MGSGGAQGEEKYVMQLSEMLVDSKLLAVLASSGGQRAATAAPAVQHVQQQQLHANAGLQALRPWHHLDDDDDDAPTLL